MMSGQLAYTLSFALGFAIAATGYVMGFSYVMQSAVSLSVTTFVGLVILLPVMLGYLVFCLGFQLMAKTRLTGGDWINGAAFTFAITILATSLMLSQAMGQILVLVLLTALLFAGGRIMLRRKIND